MLLGFAIALLNLLKTYVYVFEKWIYLHFRFSIFDSLFFIIYLGSIELFFTKFI
ncbi:hypothetical protein CKA32_000040 [Geitlerinema sp. FC II]|nr:hypothetical protein CKA32_000040 [Geitlerinema sp. FC II]